MNNETISAIYEAPAPAVMAVSDLRAVHVPADAISLHAAVGAMLDESKIDGADPGEQPRQGKSIWSSRSGCRSGLGRSDRTVLTVRLAGADASQIMKIIGNHKPIEVDERTNGDVLPSSAV